MKFLGYDNTGAQWFSVSKYADEWNIPSWYRGEGLTVVVHSEPSGAYPVRRVAEKYLGINSWLSLAPCKGRICTKDYNISGIFRDAYDGEAWVRIGALDKPIDPNTLTEISSDKALKEISVESILEFLS